MSSTPLRRMMMALAVAILASTSCLADDPDPLVANVLPGGDAEVVMREFSFKPRFFTVVAGSTVTITLTNSGFAPHEFMVGRDSPNGGGYDNDLLGQMLMAADGHGFTQASLRFQDDHTDHDHEEDSPPHEDPPAEEPHHDEPPAEKPAVEDDEHDPPADDHATDDHATDDHATDDHATDDHATDDHATDDHATDEGVATGEHAHSGASITVERGGSVTLTLNVPLDAVGSWEVGCFLKGHYEEGMRGTFTVVPPSA